MLEHDSYLLQNQMNPFPVSGRLTLDDEGILRFSLDERRPERRSAGWRRRWGPTISRSRIESGERPEVFRIPASGQKISWPKSLGGYAMKIPVGERKWIVSLNYPSGGGIWQMINMINSRGTTKPWKQALSEAGAA